MSGATGAQGEAAARGWGGGQKRAFQQWHKLESAQVHHQTVTLR